MPQPTPNPSDPAGGFPDNASPLPRAADQVEDVAVAKTQRNRWFADSALEENGFELVVPRHESRGFSGASLASRAFPRHPVTPDKALWANAGTAEPSRTRVALTA